MTELETQKKITKILVLTDLLVTELDGENLTEQFKSIKKTSNVLQKKLIPVLDRFYENEEVKKTHLFAELSNKFNYIFDRQFKK